MKKKTITIENYKLKNANELNIALRNMVMSHQIDTSEGAEQYDRYREVLKSILTELKDAALVQNDLFKYRELCNIYGVKYK